MLDRLETVQGSSDRISMTKLQVYEQQGKKKEQEDLLKGMVAKYPNDPSYVVMFCNWLINNGRTKEAGKRLQQVLKENPTDVGARLTMLDFYSATGKKEKEKDLAEQLMTEKDVPSKTKLALLRQTIIDYDKTDSTAVERLFDKILATPQKDGDMYMMKAAYMALHKQPTEAIDTVYQQALKRRTRQFEGPSAAASGYMADEELRQGYRGGTSGSGVQPRRHGVLLLRGSGSLYEKRRRQDLGDFQEAPWNR